MTDILNRLESVKGTGTSLISYYIPGNYPIGKVSSFLTKEESTASNIKNRVNRQSVESALRHCMAKIKTFRNIPDTGLVLFSGYWV